MGKQYKWFKLASSINEIQWQPNNMAIVEVNNKKLTLAIHNEAFFACAHKCPHASGIMADGFVDALGNIVCPLHRYKFNLQNGRNVSGEGYYLKTYPVETRADGLYIGFEESGFLSFFQ